MRDAIRPITPKMAKIALNPNNNWISKKSVFIERTKKLSQRTIDGTLHVIDRSDIMEAVNG